MAKEEAPAADAAAAAEAEARNRAAQQQFWQVARARKKRRARMRLVIVVGGVALGAGIAGGATVYAPGLFGLTSPQVTAAAAPSPAAPAQPVKPQGPQPLTGPAQAIDGATLTVGGQTIRLQGVQAPPASLVCRTNVMEIRCGDIARRVLDSFAGGAPVACLPATGAAQALGTVAVCRNRRGWDLAAMQVEAGWAIVQGVLESSPYRAEQGRAQANGAGLWPGFVKPEQWAQASR
jgi:endonuclease YncB( thermonuclease family)